MINILKLRQLEKERKSQETSKDEVRRESAIESPAAAVDIAFSESAQSIVSASAAKKNERKSNGKPAKGSKKIKKQPVVELQNFQEEKIPAEEKSGSIEKAETLHEVQSVESMETVVSVGKMEAVVKSEAGELSPEIESNSEIDPAEQFRQSLIEQVLNDETMISREELRKELEEKELKEKELKENNSVIPEIKKEAESKTPARIEPAEIKNQPKQPQTAKQNSYKNETDIKSKKALDSIIQLVGFIIGKEYYGIDIKRIKEINRMTEITKVPRAPQFIEGVINLRGTVIPVINLRTKVRMPKKEYDKSTRIIIVELSGKTIGFIVDGVKEVLRIPEHLLAPPPALAVGKRAEYITAVAKLENDLVILMDPEKLLTIEEASKLN